MNNDGFFAIDSQQDFTFLLIMFAYGGDLCHTLLASRNVFRRKKYAFWMTICHVE